MRLIDSWVQHYPYKRVDVQTVREGNKLWINNGNICYYLADFGRELHSWEAIVTK